ncbi:hypothetical protein SD81_006130 [Tolypothrix campylonemoides VB511288]|nr:hypothetical protein SD81_006130 [Tolypothrix campylonemoides VB511288]
MKWRSRSVRLRALAQRASRQHRKHPQLVEWAVLSQTVRYGHNFRGTAHLTVEKWKLVLTPEKSEQQLFKMSEWHWQLHQP